MVLRTPWAPTSDKHGSGRGVQPQCALKRVSVACGRRGRKGGTEGERESDSERKRESEAISAQASHTVSEHVVPFCSVWGRYPFQWFSSNVRSSAAFAVLHERWLGCC